MTNSTKLTMALALIVATFSVAAGSTNLNSPAGAATLPFAGTHGIEKPVRATKGNRLDIRPNIREIAGVTIVLRDIDQVIR